jgi:hypothetical protein
MNTKKTTDIYLTSALLALGAKLENVDRNDPRHMVFEVSLKLPEFQSENLNTAVNVNNVVPFYLDLDYYEKEWANATLVINAVAFKDAIQRMKSVIHSK